MEAVARDLMLEYTSQFPEIEVMSSSSLKLLQRGSETPFVLIDVRNDNEMNVSKITEAVTRKEFEEMVDKGAVDKGRTLCIPYCTMGYRSGKYAVELKKNGFELVQNHEGIVLWTHAGGDLVTIDSNGMQLPTKRVHTYGDKWNLVRSDYEAIYDNWWSVLYQGLLNIWKLWMTSSDSLPQHLRVCSDNQVAY